MNKKQIEKESEEMISELNAALYEGYDYINRGETTGSSEGGLFLFKICLTKVDFPKIELSCNVPTNKSVFMGQVAHLLDLDRTPKPQEKPKQSLHCKIIKQITKRGYRLYRSYEQPYAEPKELTKITTLFVGAKEGQENIEYAFNCKINGKEYYRFNELLKKLTK